jgi:hypothetical protein
MRLKLSLSPEPLGQAAQPGEKIPVHQIDQLRLVLRIDLESF